MSDVFPELVNKKKAKAGGRNLPGIAFDGNRAGVASFDTSAVPTTGKGRFQECDLGVSISSLLAGEAELSDEALAGLKDSLAGKGTETVVSLPSDQALIRVMQLPTTARDEIAGMVNLQIDKMSPFPIEDMVISHEVLSESGNEVYVAGVAVRRKLVESLWAMLGKAGVIPYRVDVNSLVWWNLIRQEGLCRKEARQVFLVYRYTSADFIAVQDGVPVLFRAFVRNEGVSDLIFMEEICDELNYAIMSMEMDIGAFTDFSICLLHSGDISEELLARPAGLCGGNIELRSMDLLSGLSRAVSERGAGAELVDLTPDSLISTRTARAFRKKLITVFAGIAGVWLLAVAMMFGGVSLQKVRLARVIKLRDAVKTEALDTRELRRKVNTIGLYVDRSRSALESVRELSVRMPQGVDLTMFNYRKGVDVRVSGEASDVNLVYAFKKELDNSALFASVTLEGPRKVRGKEVFDVTAVFPGGGE